MLVLALMGWVLVSGSDPEDGSLPPTAMRVLSILNLLTQSRSLALAISASTESVSANPILR